MGAMRSYKFLIDRDVEKVASLFPRGRVLTLQKLRLPENASDQEIVRAAWERECIIVTANGDDFISAIHEFQKKTKEKECHELNGLVVLPNEWETQRRLVKDAEKKLRFGSEKVAWFDVWNRNLCVRVKKDGNCEVKRFPQCLYCVKNGAD